MGRPKGAQNKGKRFRAAFERLFDAHPKRLEAVAEALIAQAEGGDTSEAAFIRDTVDGKPAQHLEQMCEPTVTLRTMVTTALRDHDVKQQQRDAQAVAAPSTDTRQ